jgi:hypothetical protein
MADEKDKPEEGTTGGINAVRLDADKTREQLRATLDEIEHRFTPAELWRSVTLTYKKRPVPFVSTVAASVGAIAGLIALSVARKNRG